MSKPLLGYYVDEWNKKIYRDDDGNNVEGAMRAKELWDEFEIKSGPLYEKECWSHVPAKWADDVRELLTSIQKIFGDKVKFRQIKEKWCKLTIYFSAGDEEIQKQVYKLIAECEDRLREKGVYPPKIQEQYCGHSVFTKSGDSE